MLERKVPDDYDRSGLNVSASQNSNRQARNNSSLLFRLGDEWLAIDSLCVNEITQMRTIHSLPHRDSQLVKGLVNVRGELKLCVSLGAVLKLERARESYSLTMRFSSECYSLKKMMRATFFRLVKYMALIRYTDNEINLPPGYSRQCQE